MKRIVILGAGTGGTLIANRLVRELPLDKWDIVVVDRDNQHHYQTGYQMVAFGLLKPRQVVKPRDKYLPKEARFVISEIQRIDPENKLVHLEEEQLSYDYLIITSGCEIRPDQTPGMTDPVGWRKTIFDFYTLSGAAKLHQALENFQGGHLVMHLTEMPIKCPISPIEFCLMADAYFEKRGIRDDVEITLVTPLDGAFPKPIASEILTKTLAQRNVNLMTSFSVERIDAAAQELIGFDGRTVEYDLLVTVPLNMGQRFIMRSGLGNYLGFIPVNPHTLQAEGHPDIFVIGDASNVPTSKAGSVVHFQTDIFIPNFLSYIHGEEMLQRYDGHANCVIVTGHKQAIIVDFNYAVEPVTGRYPWKFFGPLALMRQTRINYLARSLFGWVYWNLLVRGKKLPFPTDMPHAGKDYKRFDMDPTGHQLHQPPAPPAGSLPIAENLAKPGTAIALTPATGAQPLPASDSGESTGNVEKLSAETQAQLQAAAALFNPTTTKVQQPDFAALLSSPAVKLPISPFGIEIPKSATDLQGNPLEVTHDGYLVNWQIWDEALGEHLAKSLGLEMTEERWAVVRFVREDYAERGASPTIRRISTVGGFDVRRLFEIFPGKPAKIIAYISGVPKPVGCV